MDTEKQDDFVFDVEVIKTMGEDQILRNTLSGDNYLAMFRAASVDARTPREEFRPWILRCLAELGGRAHLSEVMDCIYRKVGDRLTDYDRAEGSSGRLRWKHEVEYERNALRGKGLIASSSPRGIWELTDKGHAAAEGLP